MNIFYVIQIIDGRYVSSAGDNYTEYCESAIDAERFSSEEQAVKYGPVRYSFEVIKFYDK